jgi:5'-deoxynucleotidase YfbR-like HD superfamily hydrolase
MSARDTEPRAWQRMLSGRRLDLLNPDPGDVEITDIAHGLARVPRWNGQTKGEHAFSVAQHALLVEALATTEEWGGETDGERLRQNQLVALLHDAPEYVIGDLISPFKAAVGLDYKIFELRLLEAIHLRFDLPATADPALATAVKRADHRAAFYEATRLAGFEEQEARRYFGEPRLNGIDEETLRDLVSPWSTGKAQARFLARFEMLYGGA